MATDDRDKNKYDDREIDVRSIVRLTLGLAVVVVATLGVAWFITSELTSEDQREHPAPLPIAAGAPTVPAEPRLQPAPPIDLATLRAEENRALGTYHWIDKPGGPVGIPIDRAIDLVSQRGLAARTEAFPASTVTMPSQSSLGDLKKDAP
jgi:hypothetical protein